MASSLGHNNPFKKTTSANYHNALQPGQIPIFASKGRSYLYSCLLCDAQFSGRGSLIKHRNTYHKYDDQVGGANLQDTPFDSYEEAFSQFPNSNAVNQMYQDSEVYILEPHKLQDNVFKSFNFPVDGRVEDGDIAKQMEEIYRNPDMDKGYKFNVSAGVIIQNIEDGKLRYFKPSGNAYLLDTPLQVDNREMLNAQIRHMESLDLDNRIRNYRPNTKYQVLYVTQLLYHCWTLDFPLGSFQTHQSLPSYLRQNRYIDTSFNYQDYDNCCAFVCLAQFRKLGKIKKTTNSGLSKVRLETKKLITQWREYCDANKIGGYPKVTTAAFPGLQMKHLEHFEECFKVQVNIYEMQPDKSVLSIVKSVADYPDVMHLNMFKDHLLLIKSFKLYAQKFKCKHCMAMFKKNHILMRHEKTWRADNICVPIRII